jgi:hypothetical protein
MECAEKEASDMREMKSEVARIGERLVNTGERNSERATHTTGGVAAC